MLALCIGFVSCSKDSDGGSSGSYFIEVTINGKTYKNNVLGFFGIDKDPVMDNLFQKETADYFCDIYLVYHKYKSDFATASTGTYQITVKKMGKLLAVYPFLFCLFGFHKIISKNSSSLIIFTPNFCAFSNFTGPTLSPASK